MRADIREKLLLRHAVKQEADRALAACERAQRRLVVDIVARRAGVRREEFVQRILQRADGQCVRRRGEAQHPLSLRRNRADALRAQHSLAHGKRGKQLGRIAVADNAVDRLEFERGILERDDFGERIACRMPELRLTERILQRRIVGARSGKRMIAVADGVDEPAARLVCRDPFRHAAERAARQEKSLRVSAAEHQIEIVQRRALGRLLLQRREQPDRILHQDHHMRQLEKRLAADRHAGRNALQHSRLRSADSGRRSLRVIVAFQIDPSDKTAAYTSVRQRAAQIDHRVRVRTQPRGAFRHRTADARALLLLLRRVEIRLRQNQRQRRRRAAGALCRLTPVFRLGGKLITGDDRPFLPKRRVRLVRRKQNARGGQNRCGVHRFNLFLRIAGKFKKRSRRPVHYNAWQRCCQCAGGTCKFSSKLILRLVPHAGK